jgi:hypothetical protein
MDEPGNKKQAEARAYQLFETLFAAEPGKVFTESHTFNGDIYHGFDDEIGLQILRAEPDLLVEKAQTNIEYFEMLSKAFAHSLINNLDIPQSARTFMADYLLNPKIKPPKKSGRPSNNDFNKTLRLALHELKSAGIPPSRNDVVSPGFSPNGTDIIIKILKDLGQLGKHYQTNLQRRYYREMTKFNSKTDR